MATYFGDFYHVKPLGPKSQRTRSKTVAFLLLLTLGIFGTHRFYMKRPRSGFAQLALLLIGAVCFYMALPDLKIMAKPSMNGDIALLIGTTDLGLMLRAFGVWVLLGFWLLLDVLLIPIME